MKKKIGKIDDEVKRVIIETIQEVVRSSEKEINERIEKNILDGVKEEVKKGIDQIVYKLMKEREAEITGELMVEFSRSWKKVMIETIDKDIATRGKQIKDSIEKVRSEIKRGVL